MAEYRNHLASVTEIPPRCPHGIERPDPAVMPLCDECMEAQDRFMDELHAERIRAVWRERPELPRWMQH